ncbi:MAG: hypothetical protein JSV60_00485 [Desulfobacterales bacterium]|nr:MAG: hypothetical protein JSV60_00485 [Desulfobacterales bacterium]
MKSVPYHAALPIIVVFLCCWCTFRVASARANTLLPSSAEIPAWQMAGKPYRYGPQNLYKYINGEAESFVAYGFVSLVGANYSSGSDDIDSITVDIYDMGEKLNAFGVFQSKRGRESSPLKIGAACFGTDGYLVFYKDRYYVEILSFVKGEQAKTQHVIIARKVAEKIGGDISPPYELSYLSELGRIEGSERYIKGGILGHAFLDRGLTCDYRIGDDVVSAFVAFFPSSEDAGSSFGAHKDFLQRSGKECIPLNGFGERGFVSQEPYHKTILVIQERSFVIGVYDLSVAQKGMELLKDILRRIETLN